MMEKPIQDQLAHILQVRKFTGIKRLGGGCINECYQVAGDNKIWFCKVNSAAAFPHMFEKEKAGLELIGSTGRVMVPAIKAVFASGNYQVMVQEWVEQTPPTEKFWECFGIKLARLHQHSWHSFGWHTNNYMGSVPQDNSPSKSWSDFFIHRRLQPLMALCQRKAWLTSTDLAAFEKLCKKVGDVFGQVPPALVHGDLWSGNLMCSHQEPVLVDPATYFGHPAVDLGMTTLFGGFHKRFYDAYHHESPLPANYKEQWALANLYPLLIHLYLFGSSYASRVRSTLQQFS